VSSRALAGAALALLIAGCGQPSAALFTATRSGTIADAKLQLRVLDDGHVSCNGGPLVEITSKELIDARAAARDLGDPAKKHVTLAPRNGSTLDYAFTIDGDTVRFADNSAGQDPAMYKAALLVRELAKGPCGLPR
jgi:hypothetical protein